MSSPFAPSRAPPAGWLVSDGGELVPDLSVAGYLARGREVSGHCHLRDCRRRCQLDLERLVERGLGAARVTELQRLYQCHRLDGCALAFTEQYGVELTLSMLAGRDYVGIRILCAKCRKASVVRVEAVVERLRTNGTGGPDTPVARLAELARDPCPKCQGRSWQAAVLWDDPARSTGWLRHKVRRPSG